MRKIERLKYFLFNSTSPLYIDFLDIFPELFEPNVIELSANCINDELNGDGYEYPEWYRILLENKDKAYMCLVINIKASTIEEQARFISLIKDRIYQGLELPVNCKVVVLSDAQTKVNNELKSNLVIV